MLSNKRVVTYLGCALFSILPFTKVSATENYKFAIVDRFTLGGEGRWDYLTYDVKQQRLFISRSSHVQVVDANSGKVIGDIPNTSGVHGIAIANDVNRGFTSNGKEDSVTVFDLITLKAIETIKLSGKDPDDIIYDPLSKRIFAFNGHSANVSVIDAQSLKESNVIALAGTPETAVLDGKGKIFVNIEDKNTIAVIDIAKNKVIKSFKLGDGNGPTGLAIDTKHQRLFATCSNQKMIILNSDNGKIIASLNIDAGTDAAAFDSELGIAFSSNGSGTLTAVKENDPEHFTVIQNLPTQKGARTMAYDSLRHTAFLATAAFGSTPAATSTNPKPRAELVPESFVVLKVGLKQ